MIEFCCIYVPSENLSDSESSSHINFYEASSNSSDPALTASDRVDSSSQEQFASRHKNIEALRGLDYVPTRYVTLDTPISFKQRVVDSFQDRLNGSQPQPDNLRYFPLQRRESYIKKASRVVCCCIHQRTLSS